MDIWMTWAKRKAVCHFCKKDIKVREAEVRGKSWRRHGEVNRWSFMYYWHPQCWIEEGTVYLMKTKYSSGNRGRKALDMSYNDKVERNKILRRHAAFVQRIREAMDNGKVDKVLRLYASMEKLKAEIINYGGIPEKWIAATDSVDQFTPKSLVSVNQAQAAPTIGKNVIVAVTSLSVYTVRDLERLIPAFTGTTHSAQISS
jgi:hypothetical protein